MAGKRSNYHRWNIEIPIIILIAGLIIVLMNFTNRKLDEIAMSDAEVLFIDTTIQTDDTLYGELSKAIQEFRPESCKLVEIYDEDLNLLIKIEFLTNEGKSDQVLSEYPQLVEILTNNESGSTSIETDDVVEYVYFKWAYTESGERILFMVYTAKAQVHSIWVIDALCYAILILVGILMVVVSIRNNHERIRYYNDMLNRPE